MPFIQRVLSPIAEVREREGVTALMMFAYSFLAMLAYNVIKPITRSKFIADLGADNIPYVLLAAGFIIGILMTGYTWLMGRLPRRWGLPITQVGITGLLVAVLVPVPDAADLGLGGVLRCGAAARRAADQPVLDARQHRVRPAAGEAAVRLHRRWRAAWRHRGLSARGLRAENRLDESSGSERDLHGDVRVARDRHHPPREREPGIDHPERVARAKRPSASPRPSTFSADRSTCRSSRWSSASPRLARPSSSSS